MNCHCRGGPHAPTFMECTAKNLMDMLTCPENKRTQALVHVHYRTYSHQRQRASKQTLEFSSWEIPAGGHDSGTFICLKNLRNPWGMHGKACMHTPLHISAANLTLLHKQRIPPHRARLYIRPLACCLLTKSPSNPTPSPSRASLATSPLRSDTKLKLHYRLQFCCDLCIFRWSLFTWEFKIEAATHHLHSARA